VSAGKVGNASLSPRKPFCHLTECMPNKSAMVSEILKKDTLLTALALRPARNLSSAGSEIMPSATTAQWTAITRPKPDSVNTHRLRNAGRYSEFPNAFDQSDVGKKNVTRFRKTAQAAWHKRRWNRVREQAAPVQMKHLPATALQKYAAATSGSVVGRSNPFSPARVLENPQNPPGV
jgi:hypothetical protein